MKIFRMIIFIFAAVCLASSAQMRTWTSTKGQTIEAEYVGHSMGKIVLKKANGKEIKVPPEYLSEEDQAYAAKLIPLKLSIDFSKTSKTIEKTRYHDEQKWRFYVHLGKESREPYDRQLRVELYVLGDDLHDDEKVMLVNKVWTDVLLSNEYGEVLELSTKPIILSQSEYSDATEYGKRYDSYAVFVFDDTGRMIASRSSDNSLRGNLSALRSGELYDL